MICSRSLGSSARRTREGMALPDSTGRNPVCLLCWLCVPKEQPEKHRPHFRGALPPHNLRLPAGSRRRAHNVRHRLLADRCAPQCLQDPNPKPQKINPKPYRSSSCLHFLSVAADFVHLLKLILCSPCCINPLADMCQSEADLAHNHRVLCIVCFPAAQWSIVICAAASCCLLAVHSCLSPDASMSEQCFQDTTDQA